MRLHSLRSSRLTVTAFGLLACLAVQHSRAAAAESAVKADAASTLPGGSQALAETFEDWQVVCAAPQGTKRCAVLQQQVNPNTRQRMLSVELQPKGTGGEGTLVLPFGLDLDKGVTFKTTDGDVLPGPLRIRTCLPQGCVVSIALDAKALAALRKAQTATVGAIADGGEAIPLSLSLKGLGPAFDRAAALAK